MTTIPRFLVEYFLLGRASPGEFQRFTQDAGIVADVWLSFSQNLARPRRILLNPVDGVSAIETAAVIHEVLTLYRTNGAGAASKRSLEDLLQESYPSSREWTNVAPLESYVTVTLYFDELIRVILPLTQWWTSKKLRAVQDPSESYALRLALQGIIANAPDSLPPPPDRQGLTWLLPEATSIMALIGLFAAVARNPKIVGPLEPLSGSSRPDIEAWATTHAGAIADAAVREISRPAENAVAVAFHTLEDGAHAHGGALIQRVFLDRQSQLADADAVCTVKADAADRVFNISCRNITWAIIDCGVAARHPAFDEFAPGPDGRQVRTGKSRVRASYDLTLIDRIRNFDLTTQDEDEREAVIEDIIRDLKRLPGTRASGFAEMAAVNLSLIADQLRRRMLPDWALIEPLIRIQEDDGSGLASDHGTHVAGILAGDWREPPMGAGMEAHDEARLRGICPDISLYDLRVLHPRSAKNTEFAVIAALEFTRYLNSRASGPPVIHGVNISLSIPHEVRNYGCGVTPICVACDELVQSGVVVVAAAGNRGWNEREMGFGNFVFCSITDPGNAQQVITVGATHRLKPHTYGVSYFSSRGPTGDGRIKPDLVAPGEKIRGPIRGWADDELDGTSMAAPFVSGAAAMLMARHRELMRNPRKIKSILCESATDLGRERYFQGHGLVDVLRALQSI